MKALIIYTDHQPTSIIAPCIHAASSLATSDLLAFGSINIPKGIHTLHHYPNHNKAPLFKIAKIASRYARDYNHIILHSDPIGIELGSYLSGLTNKPIITHVSEIQNNLIKCHHKFEILTLEYSQGILCIQGLYFRNKIPGDVKQTHSYLDKSSSVNITHKTNISIACGGGTNTDTFSKIQKLARQYNTTLYCSKPILDRGSLPFNHLIGISNQSTDTPLYIAFGISGDDYHMLGVKSPIIIAINNDPNAPIFQYAHYGYIGKIEDILPHFQKHKFYLDIIA